MAANFKGYKATKQSDGKYTIHNVEIFAAHSDIRGGKKITITKGWLNSAIKKAAARRADGYLPPLHIRHHGPGESVERAGHFVVTKVAEIIYQGKKVNAMFADLIDVPEAVFRRIEAGELPYRSVEIIDVKSPEIDSLALLDHETPYFRLPLLRIAGSDKTTAIKRHAQTRSPVLAYTAAAPGAAFLCNFTEAAMSDDIAIKAMDEPEAEMPEAEEEAPSLESRVEAIEAKVAEIMQMLEEKEEEAPEDEEAIVVEASAADGDEVVTSAGEPAITGKLLGRLHALEARFKAVEREQHIDGLVAKAVGELKSYGVDENAAADLKALALNDGEAALNAYVAAVKAHGVEEPPVEWTGELAEADSTPAAAMAYAKAGPEALKMAKGYAAMYETVPASLKRTFSIESFIETQMGTHGFSAVAEK